MDNNLPIDVLHWSLALLPLVLLLVMLVGLKWSGARSGWIAMAAAAAIAYFVFESRIEPLAIGFGKGLWQALFILLVVWGALLLYQVSDKAGAFQVIRQGLQRHTKNDLFLILAIGWVFSSFLQGIAGFGAPIAVVAPLLIGLGVKPVQAVIIPLIGHAWANLFGTLGVTWIATSNLVDIENTSLTLILTSLYLWIPNLVAGLMICWLFAKWKGIKEGFIAVAAISLIHGGGQFAMTFVNPSLSTFIPATLAVGVLFLLAKLERYQEASKHQEESNIMEDPEGKEEKVQDTPAVHKAFMPYYVLTGLSIVALGIPPVSGFLEQVSWGPSIPGAETGYEFKVEPEEDYSPIEPLTHPGLYLLIASVFGYIWFRKLGWYEKDVKKDILNGMKKNGIGASLAIAGFLTMSEIMGSSGQTTVLALGIAEVSSPAVYVGLANFIGIVGAFMTSSNTASNVLFSPLHDSVVKTMDSLSLPYVLSGQSAGGAIGNAIAPANVILGTSTAGIQGKDSEVLKTTLVFTLISGVLVAAVSVGAFLMFG